MILGFNIVSSVSSWIGVFRWADSDGGTPCLMRWVTGAPATGFLTEVLVGVFVDDVRLISNEISAFTRKQKFLGMI